jgi:hypothetical protein
MRLGSSSACAALFLLGSISVAQPGATNPPAAAAPVPYSSVSELNLLLSQVEQNSQDTQADLSKLRIEKWKTDANTKRLSEADVASVQRNLQSALPEMVTQLRNSPEDMEASFKLYRNLDALYDVFGSIVESAGAFGSRDEFQSLQNDLSGLERTRRSLADRIDTLASNKEGELTRLRTQVQTLQAAAAQQQAAPPKKVVVDDTEAHKKPVAKKKPAAKKPSTQSQTQPTQNPPPQPPQTQPQ